MFEHHLSPCRITDFGSEIHDLHCPIQKGILYYRRNGVIFEYNLHCSGKHEVNLHATH